MKGELVPVVMIPRFTSYLGVGTYTTVPLDISDFESITMEFWRGKLRSGTFTAYLEQASEPWEDNSLWSALSTINTADTSSFEDLTFSKVPYFRIRIVLADPTFLASGITCWAAGFLRKRIPPGAGS